MSSRSVFETLLAQLVGRASLVSQRCEGVAFLRVAKDLYRLSSVTYFCINIPIPARQKDYTHCVYSDTFVKQFMSAERVGINISEYVEQQRDNDAETLNGNKPRYITLSLHKRVGETGMFGIGVNAALEQWNEQRGTIACECRLLANYFHSHVLRINGHDAAQEMLISARELDCLRWTAVGKTAWEASIILGISERTVRFHLNAAREKLNCATTTQAVAKAIVRNLIEL